MFGFNKKNKKILDAINIINSYINDEINSMKDIDSEPSDNDKQIMQSIIKLSKLIEHKHTEDLTLYGEIMLSTEKLSDGFTQDRISIKTSNEKLNYIGKSINKMSEKLDKNVGEICDILKEYSEQKYLKTIDEDLFRGGKLKDLSIGINYLNKEITKNLKNSLQISLNLREESQTLLKNATSLSSATTNQAAALEESSAALEEINVTTKSNTQTAKMMAQEGKIVEDSISNGLNLASQTVEAMSNINDSTNAVNEAINIIDQIAFQTNILSLNAAVEAATAGEAGKGFAVVAGEVRSLASRSADAAREIKELVEASTVSATQGKNIADEMIKGYEELSSNINKTTKLIQEVTVASQEQEKSITLINSTISQIDTITQENATIAQNVKSISTNINKVANDNVEEINKAEFEGKSI